MSEKKYATTDDLETLIVNNPDPMILTDTKGLVLALNSKLAKVLGKPKDEIIGRSGFPFIGKEVAGSRKKAIEKVIKTKKPIIFEDKDKGRWWRTNINPVFDEKKNITKLATYIQDITDHKMHEEKSLANQQDYFSSLVENSNDVITVIEKDGTIRYQSPSVVKIFGYKPEEMIGKNIYEFIHPNEFSEITKEFSDFVKDEGSVGVLTEYRVKHKKGHWIYCETTKSNQLNNPEINGLIANTRDVTERRIIEQQIRESEEKFRMLSEQSLMGIAIIQGDEIKYINDAMVSITGYSKEEVLREGTKILTRAIHPDYYLFVIQQLKNKMKGDKELTSHYPVKILTKDGKTKWLEIFSKRIIYEGKNADFGTYVDITKTINAQDEIRRTRDYLDDVINSASEMILVVDKDLKIATWNKAAEIITGYKKKKILGKSIVSLDLFDNLDTVVDCLKTIDKNKVVPLDELVLRTKSGNRRIVKVTYSILKTESEHKKSILIMGKDITQDSEIHGKLIDGNSYLIIDKTKDFAVNLFKDLVVTDYDGLYLTRDTSDTIHNYVRSMENIEVFVLSQEKIGRFENVSDLKQLISNIDKFVKNKSRPIILMDRIDYFLTIFSFEAFIKSLYKINNLVARSKAVLLLRINPSFIKESQLALLREEFKQLPRQDIEDVVLQDYIYDILEYVDEQTQKNLLVTYKKVSSKFDISKVTTAKRLNIIKDKGLIFIKKHGKTKTIHITEKGSALISRSKMA